MNSAQTELPKSADDEGLQIFHQIIAVIGIHFQSDRLGKIQAEDAQDGLSVYHMTAHAQVHVRIDAPVPDALGPETAREIDLAIRALAKDAHDRAKDMLSTHQDKLEKLALALLEKETMDIAEIEELLELNSASLPEEEPAASVPAVEAAPDEESAG